MSWSDRGGFSKAGVSATRGVPLAPGEEMGRLLAGSTTDTPHCFAAEQWRLLRVLCDRIIPLEEDSPGALEAGAPEYVDTLAAENETYRTTIMGGLAWLDTACIDRYSRTFVHCARDQQTAMLDLISRREAADDDGRLTVGIAFFELLRKLTVDAFFTSEIGIRYLGYIGNDRLDTFLGCTASSGLLI